jgi:hypothetical protein
MKIRRLMRRGGGIRDEMRGVRRMRIRKNSSKSESVGRKG